MPSGKKGPVPGKVGWAFLALFFLITILAALWVLQPLVKRPARVSTSAGGEPASQILLPPKTITKQPRSHQIPPVPSPARPLLAIIIDDMGQNPHLERHFFELGLHLTFAFLPYAPFTRKLATEAHQRGFEVLVHLPLESEKHLPTPGLLNLKMDEKQIKYLVRQEIMAVPYAVGVNHHMGSLFTQDVNHVRWVLEVVKAEGLFYVDSRTTKKSVIPRIAQALQVPFAVRRVFLDHALSTAEIKAELQKAVQVAKQEGHVVVIGHPHPETLRILKKEKGWLAERVRLVYVSRVIETP